MIYRYYRTLAQSVMLSSKTELFWCLAAPLKEAISLSRVSHTITVVVEDTISWIIFPCNADILVDAVLSGTVERGAPTAKLCTSNENRGCSAAICFHYYSSQKDVYF